MEFCGKCGTNLQKECPKCNKVISRYHEFCPKCGTNIKYYLIKQVEEKKQKELEEERKHKEAKARKKRELKEQECKRREAEAEQKRIVEERENRRKEKLKEQEEKRLQKQAWRKKHGWEAISAVLLVIVAVVVVGYRNGIFLRFSEADGIILDRVTNLEWCVAPNLNANWNSANSWVDGIGDNWRMPTMDELRGLYDAGIKSGDWGHFQNSGYRVWSTQAEGSFSAWRFSFATGGEGYYDCSTSVLGCQTFAVRSR